jgi:hypothetical protein
MATSTRYKSPLTIHIIWHPLFDDGKDVADYLYSSFSRDTSSPLSRGIGIPTYYRSVPYKNTHVPKDIPLQESEFNAIVLMVDDHLFNDDKWNSFARLLLKSINQKTRIFPIAFSNNAYYFE